MLPVLAVALVAATWTVLQARGMWTAPGTMGRDLAGFLAMWVMMMTAMMLPSMAPLASRYLRSRPGWRGGLFVAGYLLLWAASGVLAWGLARGADRRVLRDLRAGVHHGTTCLGCCWSLMALMAVFGMMNVAAMVGIGLVVAVEKLWSRGIGFARAVGAASAVLAVAVLVAPELAVGLRSAA